MEITFVGGDGRIYYLKLESGRRLYLACPKKELDAWRWNALDQRVAPLGLKPTNVWKTLATKNEKDEMPIVLGREYKIPIRWWLDSDGLVDEIKAVLGQAA